MSDLEAQRTARVLAVLVANRGEASKDCPIDVDGVRLVIIESFADLFTPTITAALDAVRRETYENIAKHWESANYGDLAKQYISDEYPKWGDVFAAWCRAQSLAVRPTERRE